MKKILALFLITISSYSQTVLTDNAHFNIVGLSPAFTGERGNYGFSILLGNQFNGTLRPNQVSQVFAIDGQIKDGPSAVGFQGFRNAYGNLRTNGFNVSYAYGVKTASDLEVKIGVDLGFLVLPNAFNSTIVQRFTTFGGMGLMVKNQRFFANVSSPTLLSSTFGEQFLDGKRINIMGGYVFGNSDGFAVAPSVYYGTNTNPAFGNTINGNIKLWVFDSWIVGFSLRNNSVGQKNKLITSLEYNLNGSSRFGISYDPLPSEIQNVPGINNFNSGVIQLMYRYDLDLDDERNILNWF